MRTESCDLCVVGGGYTGLWTAIIAKERDPSRDVVLIDAREVGSAASGRNGGFMESCLTHGVANGQERFPDEIELLEQLGLENLNEIEAAIAPLRHRLRLRAHRRDRRRHHGPRAELPRRAARRLEQLRALGQDVELLDAEAMRAEVDSPTYTGGLWRKDRAALVDPARLAWGLKAAAESLGVRIYEDTKATALERDGVGVLVTTPLGRVRAGRVALGTNAFKPLLRRIGHYIAPVYDYCMVTEPLTAEQLAAIGWAQPPGPVATSPTSSTTTGSPRTTGSCGAATTPSTTGGARSTPSWRAGRRRGPSSASTSSRRSRSSRASGSATSGAARSTRAAGSACSGARRWRDGSPTRSATPASAWRRRRFGAEVMLDLLDGRRSVATETEFVREQAAAVPARAVPLRRHPGHPLVARPRGPHRQAQPLAAHPRPPRPRLRHLTLGIRARRRHRRRRGRRRQPLERATTTW